MLAKQLYRCSSELARAWNPCHYKYSHSVLKWAYTQQGGGCFLLPDCSLGGRWLCRRWFSFQWTPTGPHSDPTLHVGMTILLWPDCDTSVQW